MAAIVTGGTGFIGAEVLRLLDEAGERELFALDLNPSPRRLGELAERVEIVGGDVGNFSHVLSLVQRVRPEVLYHLGGMLSAPSELDPTGSFQANAAGTLHVLEAARLFGVPKVVFASTVGTYGDDIEGEVIDDTTLQRPQLFYGATKLFGELAGRFYHRKHGIEFRGVRFPVIIGPGVRSPGVAQWAAWSIEESAKGRPFAIWVEPRTRMPALYFRDAARSMVELAAAARAPTRIYVLGGFEPVPSAGELADLVRARVQGASISFAPDAEVQAILDKLLRPIDDRRAREEWGWAPRYDLEAMVDDFLAELERHPERFPGPVGPA